MNYSYNIPGASILSRKIAIHSRYRQLAFRELEESSVRESLRLRNDSRWWIDVVSWAVGVFTILISIFQIII